MKHLLLAILLLAATQLLAQQQLSNYKSRNPGYGVVSAQYSKFNGEAALFTGAYGGWSLHRKLMIGAGGYWLTSSHKGYGYNVETKEANKYYMGYGGLVVESELLSYERFHVTANVLVGGGILKNGKDRGTLENTGDDELKDIDASGFYVVQPSAQIEYQVTNWFRVAGGGGYRYITGVDQAGITNRKMSAPTANLSLKFGGF